MPYVLQVSTVWFAQCTNHYTIDNGNFDFTELKADSLKYVFSGNAHSQAILGFNCTVKEATFIR